MSHARPPHGSEQLSTVGVLLVPTRERVLDDSAVGAPTRACVALVGSSSGLVERGVAV